MGKSRKRRKYRLDFLRKRLSVRLVRSTFAELFGERGPAIRMKSKQRDRTLTAGTVENIPAVLPSIDVR